MSDNVFAILFGIVLLITSILWVVGGRRTMREANAGRAVDCEREGEGAVCVVVGVVWFFVGIGFLTIGLYGLL